MMYTHISLISGIEGSVGGWAAAAAVAKNVACVMKYDRSQVHAVGSNLIEIPQQKLL